MIPAEFDYVAAESVEEAVRHLRENGEDAKLLAGGHSLLPLMKLRLAAPTLLVDLRRVPDLAGISSNGGIKIGAMTTHTAIANADLGLIASVSSTIADPQVRNRGTLGGSLAHGDPASDQPAILLAYEGSVTVRGPGGERTIAAADLFVDYLQTSLSQDEIVTSVRVPKAARSAYVKFNRRAQDWAIVGAAAVVDGSSARIALTGVGSKPVRASAAEAAFSGSNAAEAAAHASDGLDPPSDTAASGEYRAHLARVLVRRALEAAMAL